jgi:SAM-dependent methyltransferase
VLAELQRRGVARVVGMDWNADNARAVAGRLHLQVVGGPGALSELVPESFDAVSMFHVLEHEQRPLELLGHARRLLVPQGRLLIAVPNGASVARRLFGRFWLGYDLPRHRLVFTPRSLRRCLEAAGFELERLSGRFSDQALDVLGSARLWCQGHNIQSRIVPAVIAGVLLPTLTLCRIVGLGSVMYGYARKR